MLWVSEGITQCLEPKAITTSEKHVQTSPISTEKSPEMAWVDKVKNININENYIYERFKQNISFNFEFCYSKRYTCYWMVTKLKKGNSIYRVSSLYNAF